MRFSIKDSPVNMIKSAVLVKWSQLLKNSLMEKLQGHLTLLHRTCVKYAKHPFERLQGKILLSLLCDVSKKFNYSKIMFSSVVTTKTP